MGSEAFPDDAELAGNLLQVFQDLSAKLGVVFRLDKASEGVRVGRVELELGLSFAEKGLNPLFGRNPEALFRMGEGVSCGLKGFYTSFNGI